MFRYDARSKGQRGFGGFFSQERFFLRCGSGFLTNGIILSTLFEISIVGLCFFDMTDKKSDIYSSLKIIENRTVI